MSYLLDTNVVSELREPAGRAAPSVRTWAQRQTPSDLTISATTVIEIGVVTRSTSDSQGSGAELLDPWEG